MSISPREIYWVLILLSIISSILYVSTKSLVKADVLTEEHAADANNNQGNVSNTAEDFLKNDILDSDKKLDQENRILEDKKKHDADAEIVSSFGDASQTSSKTNAKTTVKEKVLISVPPVSQTDATENLSETSQAVVFTLADSASVEIQHQVVSASQDDPTVKNTTSDVPQSSNLPLTAHEEDAGNIQQALPENLSTVVENKTLDSSDQYVVRAEPKIITKEQLAEKMLPVSEPALDTEKTTMAPEEVTLAMNGSSGDYAAEVGDSSTPPEDIPSFSEWAQKQLAEAEEKQKVSGNINASASPSSSTRTGGTLKLRSKNYASPDCGAKIVATNPEAASASSVLSPSRDEYLLNTCTSRIWFVVELCEAIQAKKIELANFELFSSSPREFSVYVSDRVQTRDWRSVGHFTAEDERTIQNFTLHPQLFGKYIKVEFHSHYGSEHFCPVSLFRVYGTSEFEVLERVDEVHENSLDIDDDDDDDEDGALDVDTGEPPKNLFNSAKDAVMSIVKKAAEALGKGGDVQNDTKVINATITEETALEVSPLKLCKSPRHIIVCDNCSDALFSDVYQLLSCEEDGLRLLMNSPFVFSVIRDGQLCSKFGLNFSNRRLGAPYPVKQTDLLLPSRTDPSDYVSAFFPPQYVAALCNMLAVLEKRVALNISEEPNVTSTITLGLEEKRSGYQEHGFEEVVLPPASTCSLDTAATSQSCSPSVDSNVVEFATSVPTTEPYSSQDEMSLLIKPTKTLTKEEENQESFPSADISTSSLVNRVEPESVSEREDTISSVVTPTGVPGDSNKTQSDTPELPTEGPSSSAIVESKEESEGTENGTDMSVEEQGQDTIDTLLKDLKDLDRAVGSSSNIPASTSSASSSTSVPPANVPPAQQVQKESVFLRLANRIKTLERNMSLSGQYLEELSRRYKKQMEEMQRAFNRTLAALGEESRKGHEREEKRMEEMLALQQQLTTLSSAVEVLLAERESWVYKANMMLHHVVLISVELFIFGLVLYFCRRTPPPGDLTDEQRKFSIGWKSKKYSKTSALKRRKSVDVLTMRESPKLRHRRPSEEALNIGGTYHDLLITESGVTEVDGGTTTVLKGEGKRRRRKKKELHLKSASANVVSKPAPLPNNGSEQYPEICGAWWTMSNGVTLEEEAVREQRVYDSQCLTEQPFSFVQESGNVPLLEQENSRKLSDSNLKSVVQDNELRTKRISSESAPAIIQNNGLVRSPPPTSPTLRHVSSPSFMKTAVSSRSTRHNSGIVETPPAKLKSDNWEWYSSHHHVSSQGVQLPSTSNLNGKMESEQTRRTSTLSSTADVSRKDNSKRGSTAGLKKMVKKFF